MTIRARLTFWYAGFLLLSALFIAGLSYHELHEQQRKDSENGWEEVVGIVAGWGIPAVLISVMGGWWLMHKALTPVAALTRAAEKIHDGNLHEQLPRSGNGDELDRLTEVFNAMTRRLDTSFHRIRDFTLHASHELKTPLTVMHGELETQLRDTELPSPQREFLHDQLDEVQRLTKIVEGLTFLTKADSGQVSLRREPVNLGELIQDAFLDAQVLGQSRGINVSIKECEPLSVTGDRHRLRQLLLNLTDNAIKYNELNGAVVLSLRSGVGGGAEVTISNSGPGIEAAVLPRVFDRFFRADASHNNAVEGSGLGLSIAQWIAMAHGGSIELASGPGRQTTATVWLPVVA
jgi:signal transduction histidine kinase